MSEVYQKNLVIDLIAERKLSISFSKFMVQVIDPTNQNISYIAYYATPTINNHLLAEVYSTREDALLVALQACHENKPESPLIQGCYIA